MVSGMSFCTTVDVAVGHGLRVLPLRWHSARDAVAPGVVLAGRRGGPGPTLQPSSMLTVPPGTLVALPSPNGATLCAAAEGRGAVVFAGCLRNRTAVAVAAGTAARGGPIGVVPAGERWPDDTMRVAVEDALGAGAIVAALQAAPILRLSDPAAALSLSPEARFAAAQFAAAAGDLTAVLSDLVSGRELIGGGYGDDVAYAAELDVSTAAPRLVDGILTG